MSFFSESTTKYSKEIEQDKNNLHCTSCGSSLSLKYLDEKRQMLICSNVNCLFPMDSEYMTSFIFEEQCDMKAFYSNINSLINQPKPIQIDIDELDINHCHSMFEEDEFY